MIKKNIDIISPSLNPSFDAASLPDCAPIKMQVDHGACTASIPLLQEYNPGNLPSKSSLHLIRSRSLHTQPITFSYTLLLNMLGQSQPAVLNEPALTLLNHFTTPRGVDSADLLFPSIPPDHLHNKLAQLLNLSFLEPVGITLPDSPIAAPESSSPEVLVAWLHVTNQCNLRCPYCYIHKTPDAMNLETGQQSIDAVIRSALTHQFKRIQLKFAGGEATLNFPLVSALQTYAETQAASHHLALESVVLSNGVIITDQMIDFLQMHAMKLAISLDGLGETHDTQRPFISGRGSFKQVEKSLNKLLAREFLPAISITISHRNLQGLPETVEYVLERGLPFSLNFYRENECSLGTTDLQYANQEIIEALFKTFAVIEKYLPRQSLLSSIVDRANLQHTHTRTCGVGQNYLVIDQKGNIAKCHMEIEKPITSIHAADPLDVLKQDQNGIQNLSVEEKEGCRDCAWRYWCAGGCPLLTYRATGRYDVKSPNCDIYRTIFPEVLRLEGLRILKYHKNGRREQCS